MSLPSALGLDIGGANLKAAHTNGTAQLMPFELWKNPDGLMDALRDMLKQMPKSDLLAVTMTGELCDCFETKRQGVAFILDSLVKAVDQIPIRVWTTRGFFKDLEGTKEQHLKTASANWLALATFVGRYVPSGSSLLIDIGSTTTDIVALLDGKPVPRGRTDFERLQSRELVYSGVRRTPICSLLGPEGAAELFATTLDIYLLLGELKENPSDMDTADGRPATRAAAHARLARMVGADSESFSEREAINLAQQVFHRQLTILRDAVNLVASRFSLQPLTAMISGSGEFLARKVPKNMNSISLADKLGPEISQAACAYAVAVLAQESMVKP